MGTDRSSSDRAEMMLGHNTQPQPLRVYFRKKWRQQNVLEEDRWKGIKGRIIQLEEIKRYTFGVPGTH